MILFFSHLVYPKATLYIQFSYTPLFYFQLHQQSSKKTSSQYKIIQWALRCHIIKPCILSPLPHTYYLSTNLLSVYYEMSHLLKFKKKVIETFSLLDLLKIIFLVISCTQFAQTLKFTSPNQITLLKFQLIYPLFPWPILGCLIDISNLMCLYNLISKVGPSRSHVPYSCLWRPLPHWVWVAYYNKCSRNRWC